MIISGLIIFDVTSSNLKILNRYNLTFERVNSLDNWKLFLDASSKIKINPMPRAANKIGLFWWSHSGIPSGDWKYMIHYESNFWRLILNNRCCRIWWRLGLLRSFFLNSRTFFCPFYFQYKTRRPNSAFCIKIFKYYLTICKTWKSNTSYWMHRK